MILLTDYNVDSNVKDQILMGLLSLEGQYRCSADEIIEFLNDHPHIDLHVQTHQDMRAPFDSGILQPAALIPETVAHEEPNVASPENRSYIESDV